MTLTSSKFIISTLANPFASAARRLRGSNGTLKITPKNYSFFIKTILFPSELFIFDQNFSFFIEIILFARNHSFFCKNFRFSLTIFNWTDTKFTLWNRSIHLDHQMIMLRIHWTRKPAIDKRSKIDSFLNKFKSICSYRQERKLIAPTQVVQLKPLTSNR